MNIGNEGYHKQEYKQMIGIAWQEGGVRTLQTYFPDSRKMVVDNLYKKPDVVIWVPTRYLYGIFYGHTPVVIPEQNWTIQNLIQSKPNYIITASKEITAANWVEQLAGMIQYCPTAFTALNEGRNRFQYIVYEVDGVILKNCYDRS